jgi:hypothetical protein
MTRLAVVIVALLAVPAVASAQGDGTDAPPAEADAAPPAEEPPPEAPPPDDEPPPDDAPPPKANKSGGGGGEMVAVGSPKARMTLPGGKFMFTAVVEANLAEGAAGKPLSVAPDLWIGVHDRFTFGIIHSGRAATGFLSGFGTGLCFREDAFCATGLGEVYTFAAAEARIGLLEGGFPVAFVAGAQARAFEPELLLAAKGGFLARIHSSRFAVELAPAVYIGMNKRDFNPDLFGAPVTIYLRIAGGLSLALQGGITFALDDAGNTWQVPAAAGITWWLTPHISFDAAFGLGAVLDSDDMTKAFDQRSITGGFGYAL